MIMPVQSYRKQSSSSSQPNERRGFLKRCTSLCFLCLTFVASGVYGHAGYHGVDRFHVDVEESIEQSHGFAFRGSDGLLGTSLAGAGDFNGDGYDDIIAGSRNGDDEVFLIFGSANIEQSFPSANSSQYVNVAQTRNGANGIKFTVDSLYPLFGWSVAGVGDVNADGYDDIAIGAAEESISESFDVRGSIYVVFGGPEVGSSGVINVSNLNGTDGFTLRGRNSQSLTGDSVAAAGDQNGDGISDFVVSAWNDSQTAGSRGAAFVVYGSPTIGQSGSINVDNLNGSNGYVAYTSAEEDGQFAYEVLGGRDVNDDGTDDLMFTSWNQFTGETVRYLVFGGANTGQQGAIDLNAQNAPLNIKFINSEESTRGTVAFADISGDGTADVLMPYNENGAVRLLALYGGSDIAANRVVDLAVDIAPSNGMTLTSYRIIRSTSTKLVFVGDWDDDGLEDIGMVWNALNEVWIVYGGLDPQGGSRNLDTLTAMEAMKIDFSKLVSRAQRSNFGYYRDLIVPTALGDINGDGSIDLGVGNGRFEIPNNGSPNGVVVQLGHNSGMCGGKRVTEDNVNGREYHNRFNRQVLLGTPGDDVITTTGSACGLGGNDVIRGSFKNNYLDGGDGNDTIHGLFGDDQIVGGAGNDLIYGGGGRDIIDGGYGDDRIFGQSDDDQIVGGKGNDSINGGHGNDTLQGQYGDDHLFGGFGDDVINGNVGHDSLFGGFGVDKLYGDDGNDRIFAGSQNDRVYGGAGDDEIYGQAGDDILKGEAGNDLVNGGGGNDDIDGGSGTDKVLGGFGDDTVDGGADIDQIFGGAGNDYLRSKAFGDNLFGGPDYDTCEVNQATNYVVDCEKFVP